MQCEDALAYGTGGFAYARISHLYSESFGAINGPATTNQTTGTSSEIVTGWVAGGGLEWAVADHWIVRGEYLFTQFSHESSFTTPSFNANCGVPNACSFTLSPNATVQMVRLGLNYKF